MGINPSLLIISLNEILFGFLQMEKVYQTAEGFLAS